MSTADNNGVRLGADLEAKRQQNLEDNRRFLAALKINDIREEIKQITGDDDKGAAISRRAMKKETQSDAIRRSSRIRQHIVQSENLPPVERKPRSKKKTDENDARAAPKVKLQLPEHMLIRYQSTGKKVALHNTKATFDGADNENLLM